jgi:hypothetical protein
MTTAGMKSTVGLETVAELAAQLRVDSIRSSTSRRSAGRTRLPAPALRLGRP